VRNGAYNGRAIATAIYIKSLGAIAAAAQPFLPSDQQPRPPYIEWPAPPK